MPKERESGKLTLIKGSLEFLWEDIKTLNRKKLRALSRIFMGYLRMRFSEKKKISYTRT